MKIKKAVFSQILFFMLFVFPVEKAFSFGTLDQFDLQDGYFSIDLGIDNGKSDIDGSLVDGSAIIGKGLNSYISAYLGVKVQGNKFFSDGFGGLFLGSITTLYSFKKFSLDLSVEAGFVNDAFYAKPGFELNYDFAPDQKFMGFYFDINEEFTGVDTSWDHDDTSTEVDESTPKHVFAPETEFNIGYYFSFIEGQQLLLGLDQRFRNNPLTSQNVYKIDALKIGYNVMVSNGFQIQTELDYHITHDNNKSKYGFRVGLIKY
jgi:hypothetical protein